MISKDLYDNLDDILDELGDYIKATYGEHYVGETEIQGIDVWETNGSLLTTSRDTALKYLQRFGKKDGYNKKDLLKALHYILIMYAKSFPPEDEVIEDVKISYDPTRWVIDWDKVGLA